MQLLRDALGVRSHELTVLSVCATAAPDGWRMTHATLLAVPRRCAELSWSDWYRDECGGLGTHRGAPLPAQFVLSGEEWLLARAVLTRIVHETGAAPMVGAA